MRSWILALASVLLMGTAACSGSGATTNGGSVGTTDSSVPTSTPSPYAR